ncbi:MAG TPA: CoA ester lyase [Devosia sp.]|nr:CoA ester lyase [Devosia sp.]
MQDPVSRARRSALFVPASNERALQKAPALASDAVILDLEDAVAVENKAAARARVVQMAQTWPSKATELVIRVNAMSSAWGQDDLAAASACGADALLLSKVETPEDIAQVSQALGSQSRIRQIWAMIETPKAILNIAQIAEAGRACGVPLSCLVAGPNDLAKATGVSDRNYLTPWLMQIVLAARAWGLTALDGVSNQFNDADAFARECAQGAAMGFDGKTLIHPNQIDPANRVFAPSPVAIEAAGRIVALFARPENATANVVSMDGEMVERLHLLQAQALLAKATAIAQRDRA